MEAHWKQAVKNTGLCFYFWRVWSWLLGLSEQSSSGAALDVLVLWVAAVRWAGRACVCVFSLAVVAQPPWGRDWCCQGHHPASSSLHSRSTRALGRGFFGLPLLALLHLSPQHLTMCPQVFPDPGGVHSSGWPSWGAQPGVGRDGMLDLLVQPPAFGAHEGLAGLGTALSLLRKLSLLLSPLIGKHRNFPLVSLRGGTGNNSLDVLLCEQRGLAGGCQGEPTRCSLRWGEQADVGGSRCGQAEPTCLWPRRALPERLSPSRQPAHG